MKIQQAIRQSFAMLFLPVFFVSLGLLLQIAKALVLHSGASIWLGKSDQLLAGSLQQIAI